GASTKLWFPNKVRSKFVPERSEPIMNIRVDGVAISFFIMCVYQRCYRLPAQPFARSVQECPGRMEGSIRYPPHAWIEASLKVPHMGVGSKLGRSICAHE